ncbi:MAG: peptidase S45 family protein [Chloroflexi bacterium OLB14]|nr:MAG: peptidase S45 family protein [Chloroflexi bacterium OLB14]
MKKIVSRILIGLLVIVVIAVASGAFYFKSYLPNTIAPKSFPQTNGEIQVTGLNGKVDVYRDNMGIPHIYANNSYDLFFAQGYIHAQDRFWQMDFWRHIGSGSLSEMFGEGQLETDIFLRTLGWKKTAEAEWAALDAESKAILQAYVDGVNAYIKDKDATELSLEYAILGLPILAPDYQIAEWTPVNSLTWGKAMAWDLRGNMDEEIQRAVLLKTLTPEQLKQLFPEYPQDHPVIVNKIGDGSANTNPTFTHTFDYAQLPLDQVAYNASLLDPVLGEWNDGIGSNSWVVSGKLTDTGMPYLSNDPHLGIQMPSIWYQIGLHCVEKNDNCPFEVAGFSFAGVPGVVIGHNDKIAWGFTNVGPDVMDLYIEKVNPENPNQYEVNGEWVDFESYEETIYPAGGEAVTVTVRSTRHGPVISETFGALKNEGDPEDKEFVPFNERAGIELPEQYVIALKWTALTPSTPFEAIWGFDKAENWEEFREAASNFHVPAQNLIYADVEGNIGYQMPGDIPIRKNGDGTLPVPGWTDDYEWIGFIPFEEQPYTFNPEEGYIVTANNQVPPNDYPYFISADWDYGFRADRILTMIENAPAQIDIAYLQQMHGDSYDANAEVFVPIMQAQDWKFAKDNEAVAFDTLADWDYQDRIESTSAAVFNAFWRAFLKNTFNDDISEKRYYADGGSRWNEIMRKMAQTPNDPFWDDKTTTDVVETMPDIIKKSFSEGVAELEGIFGKNVATWNWGDMHASTFRNGTLGESGISLIEDLFNRGPFPTSGGESLVNATGWSVRDGYETNWLPSMRMIVDLSNLNNSQTVHTTGQSGHAYHPHYDDMAQLWADVSYYPMWWEQESIVSDSEAHLILMP